MRGLLQGHSATILRVFPYAAIKFMAYDQVHHVGLAVGMVCVEMLVNSSTIRHLCQHGNLRQTSVDSLPVPYQVGCFTPTLLLACINLYSGMISVCFTYPLEVIRVRMAFQTRSSDNKSSSRLRPSFMRAMSQIYHEGVVPHSSSSSLAQIAPKHLFSQFPVLKFYRGFSVTIVGMIPYAGTSFLCWGFLRARFLSSLDSRPTPIADLCIGALSGALGQTVSYPFEVIRRRMQVGGLTRPDRWLRPAEIIRAIWTAGGWRGFFVGLSVGYLKVVPMTAVSFAVWQGGKRVLGV